MQLDALGSLDLEILFPPICGAVASGIQEAVEHGEEDGPFQRESASAFRRLSLDDLIDAQLVPQSLKDKGGTDGQRAVGLDGALAVSVNKLKFGGELRHGLGEVVDFARRSEGIDLTQSGEHALTDFFAFTLTLDDLKVFVAVRVFDADEH
jgi:hypothetical protein